MRPDMPAPYIIKDEEFNDLVQPEGVSVSRAHELELDFLKSFVTSDKVLEYGGHITCVYWEQNCTVEASCQYQAQTSDRSHTLWSKHNQNSHARNTGTDRIMWTAPCSYNCSSAVISSDFGQ